MLYQYSLILLFSHAIYSPPWSLCTIQHLSICVIFILLFLPLFHPLPKLESSTPPSPFYINGLFFFFGSQLAHFLSLQPLSIFPLRLLPTLPLRSPLRLHPPPPPPPPQPQYDLKQSQLLNNEFHNLFFFR